MTGADLVAFVKKSPVVVACGAVSVGMLFGLYFRSDKISEAETLLSQKTTDADRYGNNLKNAVRLKEDHGALVAANKVIEGRAVRPVQLLHNAQYFYELERESGVKLLDSRQTRPGSVAKPAKGTYVPVAFSVRAEGTLPQVLDFLRRIESGAHYSRVMMANCSTDPEKRSSQVTLALTVELLGLP